MKQLLQWIEELVHHSLLQWDDRIFGDRNRLRAHLAAAGGDVAIPDVVLLLQIAHPVFGIQRMHLQRRCVDEEARADKLVVLVMVPQHVADVLA